MKTVVLHSPGGSVHDALAMGRLIREKKFATEVESRPLLRLVVPAGVRRRRRAPRRTTRPRSACIRSSALGSDGHVRRRRHGERAADLGDCQKYLRDMGVDLGVWVHAMETPHDELYYFKPDELLALKLATSAETP